MNRKQSKFLTLFFMSLVFRKNNNGYFIVLYLNICNMAGKSYWLMQLNVVLKQLEIFNVLFSRDL